MREKGDNMPPQRRRTQQGGISDVGGGQTGDNVAPKGMAGALARKGAAAMPLVL